MASIEYEEIFANFLGCITDTTLISLDTNDIYELEREWLHKTLAKPELGRIFSSIKLDDTVQTLTYKLTTEIEESRDKEFVIMIAAKGMVVEWLQPQVKKTSLIHQHITSSKESKFYSQSSHIDSLESMLEDTKLDVQRMLKSRGFIYNSYLGGV